MNQLNISINHLISGDEVAVFELDYENNCELGTLHRNNYCQLILIEKGGGTQIVDVNQHAIKSDCLYLICPNQIHQMNLAKETKGMVLNFSIDCFAFLSVNHYLLTHIGYLPLSRIEVTEMISLFQNIGHYAGCKFSNTDKKITLNYLSILLLKIIGKNAVRDQNTFSEDLALFEKFYATLEENFKTERTIKAYEEFLGVPYKRLNAVVKQKTGKTALQIIHERLMLEIKRLLAHTKLSQKEISYALNFDSAATFNQFVKKQTSLKPSEIKQILINS